MSEASTGPARALAELTTIARERPEVGRFLENGQHDAARLPGIDADFAAAFAGYHDEFGLRPIRYEVAVPSVEETPSLSLHLIADQLRSGFDPAAVAAEVARQAGRRPGRSPPPCSPTGPTPTGPASNGHWTGPSAGTRSGKTCPP